VTLKLKEFKNNAKKGNPLDTFYLDLKNYVEKAKTNNDQLIGIIDSVLSNTNLILTPGKSQEYKEDVIACSLVLTYVTKWIDERVYSLDDKELKLELNSIRTLLVDSKSNIDSIIPVLKELKKALETGDKESVKTCKGILNENLYRDKTGTALLEINDLLKKEKRKSFKRSSSSVKVSIFK